MVTSGHLGTEALEFTDGVDVERTTGLGSQAIRDERTIGHGSGQRAMGGHS